MSYRQMSPAYCPKVVTRFAALAVTALFVVTLASCVETTVARIRISQTSIGKAEINAISTILIQQGLIAEETKYPDVLRPIDGLFYRTTEPHLTVSLQKSTSSEAQLYVVFVEVGRVFGDEALAVYRSALSALRKSFGEANVQADSETSRGQKLK